MTATAIKGPEKQAIIRSTGRDQYAEFIFSPDRDSKHIEIALIVPSLNNLPKDLIVLIISHLDMVDTICLSLVNKRMRNIYLTTSSQALHRLPKLTARCRACTLHFFDTYYSYTMSTTACGIPCTLYMRLTSWMPKHLVYCFWCQKFTKRETKEEHCWCEKLRIMRYQKIKKTERQSLIVRLVALAWRLWEWLKSLW